MEFDTVDTDYIVDWLLANKSKDERKKSHETRKREKFMEALGEALERVRDRPELTFSWGRKFWSRKPILGSFRIEYSGKQIWVKYGLGRTIFCYIKAHTFWIYDGTEVYCGGSVSEAFSMVISFLLNAKNMVPQK